MPVRNIHQAPTPATRSKISASLRCAVSGREHLPLHFSGLNDDGHIDPKRSALPVDAVYRNAGFVASVSLGDGKIGIARGVSG